MARECVSHHHACDCREEIFSNKIKELEAQLEVMRDALESIAKDYDRPSDMMKKAREVLKKIGEV